MSERFEQLKQSLQALRERMGAGVGAVGQGVGQGIKNGAGQVGGGMLRARRSLIALAVAGLGGYALYSHPPMQSVERGEPVQTEHEVALADLPFEFMMNALRLIDGVPSSLFGERTGLPLARIARPLGEAVERGLLDPDPTRLRPTLQGQRFLNDLLTLFLREEN